MCHTMYRLFDKPSSGAGGLVELVCYRDPPFHLSLTAAQLIHKFHSIADYTLTRDRNAYTTMASFHAC